jgi:MFS family permease
MPAASPIHTVGEDGAYRRFLRYYYLTHFWYDFIFAYAVYTVYFSLRGMSVMDISLLLSWWSITSMALEVPSGALADTWSRRKLLVLAPLIKLLCFVVWFFAKGQFWLFALGFLLWSLGSSLRSGTSEALLYDTLVHHGRREEYEKALGRREFYFHLGLAISMVTGGVIASYRMDWAILFSVAPLLLSAFFALRLEEPPKVESTGEVRYLEHLRLGFREIRSNRALLYLMIALWGLSVFGVLEEFDQLYYHLVGLPIPMFGVVAFVGSLLAALAARVAYRLKGRGWALYLLPLTSAALLVPVWRYPSLPMIGLLVVSCAITTPALVLVDSRIQHSIRGVSRATVTSAVSLLLELPVRNLAFGLIGTVWKLQAIYLAGALLLLALSVWASGVRKQMNVTVAEDQAENETGRHASVP